MAYAFQHFKAIEYGYKIESMKSQRESLVEMNRALRLEEASLRDPERIDRMARDLGLQSPQAGQVIRMDTAMPEPSISVVASLTPISVVSIRSRDLKGTALRLRSGQALQPCRKSYNLHTVRLKAAPFQSKAANRPPYLL
jgi:cell division protein FtsL